MENYEALHAKIAENLEGEIHLESLKENIKGIHAADIATLLEDFTEEQQVLIFKSLPDDETAQEVLACLEGEILSNILANNDAETIAHYLEEMPPDEAVDVLEDQTEEVVKSLFSKLEPDTASELQSLRQYPEGTAGSLMTTDFLSVKSHAKVKDIINIIRDDEIDLETIDVGYALTDANKILGQFYVHDLIGSAETAFVLKFIEEDFLYVKDTDSQDVVLQLMSRHGLSIIPVVDFSGVMKGIITADDMLEVAKEEMDRDFYQMAGTSFDPTDRSILSRVRYRFPWLACTLVGGSISALIMRNYKFELEIYALLTIFIPFIVGMSGNVGIQSATIIVRDLVNKGSQTSLRKNLIREVLTGWTNAILFAGATALILLSASHFLGWENIYIGPVIGLGLMLAMFFASILGALIPVLFDRLKIDPAIASGPIITALIDIIGLSIYLFTSTKILGLLNISSLSSKIPF